MLILLDPIDAFKMHWTNIYLLFCSFDLYFVFFLFYCIEFLSSEHLFCIKSVCVHLAWFKWNEKKNQKNVYTCFEFTIRLFAFYFCVWIEMKKINTQILMNDVIWCDSGRCESRNKMTTNNNNNNIGQMASFCSRCFVIDCLTNNLLGYARHAADQKLHESNGND